MGFRWQLPELAWEKGKLKDFHGTCSQMTSSCKSCLLLWPLMCRYRWSYFRLWLLNNTICSTLRFYDTPVCSLPHRMEIIYQTREYLVQKFWTCFECCGISFWTELLQRKVWINLFCILTRFPSLIRPEISVQAMYSLSPLHGRRIFGLGKVTCFWFVVFRHRGEHSIWPIAVHVLLIDVFFS